MIPWLTANRLLAEVLGALALVVGLVIAWQVHDHAERAIGAAKCQQAVTETRQQAELDSDRKLNVWIATHKTPAENIHAQEIAALPTLVVHTPVWLSAPGEICPDPVRGQADRQTGADPGPGRTVIGPGRRDIRPGLEAFKLKYETALAGCRQTVAELP